MASAVAAAIALALMPLVAGAGTSAATAAPTGGSIACRGPARMVDFGGGGRIGAKWNAVTQTIAFGRPAKDGHYHAFIADFVLTPAPYLANVRTIRPGNVDQAHRDGVAAHLAERDGPGDTAALAHLRRLG